MKNIDLSSKDVKELNDSYIGRGSECSTYKFDDNGNIVALQIFNTEKADVLENKLKKAIRLNQKNLDERFIIPQKTVTVDGAFKGFTYRLLNSSNNFQDLTLTANKSTKLELLRQAKDIILTLKDNDIVHGDLSTSNFLILDNKVHLIDMHNASVGGLPLDVSSYLAKQYLKHNEADSGLDIYLFNLLTYSVLKRINDVYAAEAIKRGSISKEIQDVYDNILEFKNMNEENMLIDRINKKAKIRLL